MAVSNTEEFVSSVQSADDGDVVEVDDHSLIRLNDYRPGDFDGLADNLTIISGDEPEDRPASTIHYYPDYSDDDKPDGMLLKTWRNLEFRGFKVYGPEPRVIDLDRDHELGFIHGMGDRLEIGGCYFEGFPFTAIASGSMSSETEFLFENSTVRNCQMEGYGYAVEQYNGHATYHNLDVDHTRHGIAGFGWPNCSYEARYVRFGPHTLSHQLDMHRASESAGQSSLDEMGAEEQDAGGDIHVHHCTFEMTHDWNEEPQEGIAIRGVPTGDAMIENNWFKHPAPEEPGSQGSAVRQQTVDEWTNLELRNNHYNVNFTLPQHASPDGGNDNSPPAPEPEPEPEPEPQPGPLTKEEILEMLSGEEMEVEGTVTIK